MTRSDGESEARAAMEAARQEVVRWRHDALDTCHLLVGLLETPSRAARILEDEGCRVEAWRATFSAGGSEPTGDQLPYAPRMRTVLETAASLGAGSAIGADHLLLALIEAGGPAARWLEESCDLDRVAARARRPSRRRRDGHKGTFGDVLIVAGSRAFAGAAVLAGEGASRAGAGLIRLAVPRSIAARVGSTRASRIVHPQRESADGGLAFTALADLLELARSVDAVVLGPGLGQTAARADLVRRLWRRIGTPLVVDADGLNLLAPWDVEETRRSAATVLTPHPGEAARLLGIENAAVNADRTGAARRLHEATGATVILKGRHSVICGDGDITCNATGNPGLATGGTGDVLSGVVGTFLAQGFTAFEAADHAAEIHGRAGDLAARATGEAALTPEDVLDALPAAVKELLG